MELVIQDIDTLFTPIALMFVISYGIPIYLWIEVDKKLDRIIAELKSLDKESGDQKDKPDVK